MAGTRPSAPALYMGPLVTAKPLTFHKLFIDPEGNAKKRYLARAFDCNICPIREQYKKKKAKGKRLHITQYNVHYELVMTRLALRLRPATLEPVLGSLNTYWL
jgi:hypothetical protein